MALFEAHGIHKRFGRQVVLENIDLAFESGRLSGIMGPNGAGKTTCFNVLTGAFKPDRGRVVFDGEDITGLSPNAIARRGISRSFQTMSLFDEYSALENVLIALPEVRARGFNMIDRLATDGETAERAAAVLTRVGLCGREHRRAGDLAYGERRALEIGVALAAEPRLLFLDEPTSGLGTEATARLGELVQDLKRDYSIVVIEHDMRFLFGLADTISVIHWGQVIAGGTPDELRREQMGSAVQPGRTLIDGSQSWRLHVEMQGWVSNPSVPGSPWRVGRIGVILEIADIETFYGETQALFGVTLSVGPGEVVALLGPSGAGKTTTLRSILGLTPARRGTIRFAGGEITAQATHEIARLGIGWVPDDRRVFPTLTVARNLSIARKRTRFRSWSLDEMFGIFSALEHLMDRECENLSGGEMQMVAISRALLGAPGLVLFDEPSQGLAPKVVQDVMATVSRLKEAGVSALVVEQNASTALQVSDRAYVMDRGRIVHEGPAADLLADDDLRVGLLGV